MSILAGREAYEPARTITSAPELLPPAERRRVGVPVKLALAVAHEACVNAARDPSSVATVFSSSGGDGDTVHHILETLSTAEREVSPTRFHNSVHNAAAGYWSIATRSRQPSASLCCHDASFAAGLLDAATQAATESAPVALVAYDHPYPEPLHAKRPILDAFAVSLVLCAERTRLAIAELTLSLAPVEGGTTPMLNADLEMVRTGIPAGRSLPLLATLAQRSAAELLFENGAMTQLHVAVAPC